MPRRFADEPLFLESYLVSRNPVQALLISGAHTWHAGEAHAEVTALQARLLDARVVAVLADNGPAWVMVDLARQTAGVVHLPLPDFFNAAHLRHTLC